MYDTKRKCTRRVQVYDTEVNEKYHKDILGYDPMPDKVIYRVNILGRYKQELLLFNYRKGQLIGYCDVDITGVDGDRDANTD